MSWSAQAGPEALEIAQATRIRIQRERDAVDAVDCTTPRAHYLRGAYETALEIEDTLRHVAARTTRQNILGT